MSLQKDHDYSQEDLDNYSRQLDHEHDTYWKDRGYDERPDDWKEQVDENK
ncbi:MAG: hypothetical protein K8R54_04165 [Bacteroidales bacterium]|nr:hypothetical protein [Bacteroidales bacterium]